jgi:small redox-active disulfide protein 2
MRTIKVLGTGCGRCALLAKNAEAAARELGIPCALYTVTDIDDILEYGVLTTPALVIDGKVKVVGKTASVEEIKKLLQ